MKCTIGVNNIQSIKNKVKHCTSEVVTVITLTDMWSMQVVLDKWVKKSQTTMSTPSAISQFLW